MALRASCKRNIGGRRNHDRAGERNGLNQRQRHVSRARRQIHDQVVELSPDHRAQKLLDDRMQHGAAPDQRLVARIQEPYRDDLEAVGFERLNPVVAENFGLRADAEHQRHVGTVNVGIEQTDFVSQLG